VLVKGPHDPEAPTKLWIIFREKRRRELQCVTHPLARRTLSRPKDAFSIELIDQRLEFVHGCAQ